MGLLDRSPPLPVAMAFQWTSETVPNALVTSAPSGRSRHILANEAVFDLTVTGSVGDRSTLLRRRATPQQRFYDPTLDMYTTSRVAAPELERLLDPTSNATYTLDLHFALLSFFDVLLAQMTRTDDELRNVAHPDDSREILRTFDCEERDGKVEIVYAKETHSVRAVPCRLVDIDIKPQASPHPPGVKLLFEIDFQSGIDAVRREAMRKLVAMDWSGLARYADGATPPPTHIKVWNDNVLLFLANQTDMQRAERFRTSIAARHAAKRPRQLAEDLREDIDLHLITANRWPELREDRATERHQALLSDLLERLHQGLSLASPTRLGRELVRRCRLDLDQNAALSLQYGTGHCGEHSRAAFSILRTIASTPGSHIDSAVLCGNANLDHGFVLCNLQVTRVILTTAASPANTRVKVGQAIKVFNLRDALRTTDGRRVFVVDPYVDRSMSARTAARLLLALNSKGKQRAGKDTDFLVFQRQFPEPDDFAIEDIRDRPAAERMTRVKNV